MKRIFALLLIFVFLFSLCACDKKADSSSSSENTTSSSVSGSFSPDHVGTWKMESYDTQESDLASGYKSEAILYIKADNTFSLTGIENVDEETNTIEDFVTGVYVIDGSKLTFTVQKMNDGSGAESLDETIDFTGEIASNGKLNCVITDHSVVFVKQ